MAHDWEKYSPKMAKFPWFSLEKILAQKFLFIMSVSPLPILTISEPVVSLF